MSGPGHEPRPNPRGLFLETGVGGTAEYRCVAADGNVLVTATAARRSRALETVLRDYLTCADPVAAAPRLTVSTGQARATPPRRPAGGVVRGAAPRVGRRR